ncbi:MAG: type II toxin-antitoxin system HipA family toxin [Deltaproteobacteria bacterium]|nr:type II toxin-antitoxin system HipA family toxin [Deltaproteobacteria bacterium]
MKKLEVLFRADAGNERIVGTLAEADRVIYFEFDPSFLASGWGLSPFRLPFREGLYEHKDLSFGPLPGLFDDSLPDGWGLLLMDQFFQSLGVSPAEVSPLDRLAYLGSRTMGALVYQPSKDLPVDTGRFNLQQLAKESQKILAGHASELLSLLFKTGGSPGGARPKVLIGYSEKKDQVISGEEDLPSDFQAWMVKFAATDDDVHAGLIEQAYALMAKASGIYMPPTRLFRTEEGESFFGIKRFDRQGGRRIHIHTFGNLIHANFRIPSADYNDLLKATALLTHNHEDVEEAFRRMVFNVMAHNRDDHVKNFSFLFDDQNEEWSLSPAYDLTLTDGPGGEHSMTLAGEGKHPGLKQIMQISLAHGIKKNKAQAIIKEVGTAIKAWPDFADQAGLPAKARDAVSNKFLPIS